MLSIYKSIRLAKPDPILGLSAAFLRDPSPSKINLGVGAYRDNNGNPWTLPSVALAEEALARSHGNHEYVPILGSQKYIDSVQEFLFKEDKLGQLLREGKILTGQGLSGTGSLRVLGEFMHSHLKIKTIHVSTPTWPNHVNVFTNSSLKVAKYPYYDPQTKGLAFHEMLDSLSKVPYGDAILLHSCCHNPTGVDPTQDQWREILAIIKKRQLFPVIDMAYQGFAESLQKDMFFPQLTAKLGIPFILSQSFAKNMGLYGERIGSFSIILNDESEFEPVKSQISIVARAMYSSPPKHGAEIVSYILTNDKLLAQWETEVSIMRDRLANMRHSLYEELTRRTDNDWSHLIKQKGMFAFTGLNVNQVHKLREKNVYLTDNGRISIAGINNHNVNHLADAIAQVCK